MHLSLELILFFNTRVLVSLGFLCIPKLAGNNYHLRMPCKFDTLSASLLSQHFLSYIVVELGSHVCWFLLSSLTLVHLFFLSVVHLFTSVVSYLRVFLKSFFSSLQKRQISKKIRADSMQIYKEKLYFLFTSIEGQHCFIVIVQTQEIGRLTLALSYGFLRYSFAFFCNFFSNFNIDAL